MANTIRDLIDRAMKVPGVLGVGQVSENEDAVDHLADAQDLYMGLVGEGANLKNVLITDAYTTGENVRVAYSGATMAAITLPVTIAEASEDPSTDAAVDNDNRQPHDFAVAQVAGATPQTYVYDRSIGDWVKISGLTLTTIAPWMTFLGLGIVAMLAELIAAKHGYEIKPPYNVLAAQTRLRIIAKLQSSGDDDGSVFFQPDLRQVWG